MKLSTRGRYGLKAMVDLAVAYGSGAVTAGKLADLQGISVPYLEQLVAVLRKGGLITSMRGAQGGYVLAREPETISVREVLEVLEGNTALVDCVGYDHFDCENACSCSARPLFLKLQSKINAVLDTTTLKDMADDYIMQKRRMNDETGIS